MSVAESALRPAAREAGPPAPGMNARVVAVALALLAAGGYAAFEAGGGRMAWLFVIGGGLGIALYHAAFGFTGSWRAFIREGRGAGLRAQMVMLAVATAIFLPILQAGEIFGHGVGGAVAPVGPSVMVGAFLFGVGMQLGGACASGSLFTAGGGNTRIWITLFFFIIGSFLGSLHLPWWYGVPHLGSVSVLSEFGLVPALLMNGAVFAAIAYATVVVERRRNGGRVLGTSDRRGLHWRRVLHGPWPMVAGGVALALLNGATLMVSGHPWGVTSGYMLWGAKLADLAGIDVTSFTFWSWEFNRRALEGSLFAHDTSTMNFGILLGALLAAGLAGKFAPSLRIPGKLILASVVGGLMMGYGARLAFGCNIGAFFSGVASGSLHGWLWLLCAIPGNLLGVKLRPLFGMDRS